MTFNKNCTCYSNRLTCGTFFTSTMCRYFYLCCCCCRCVVFSGLIFFFACFLSIDLLNVCFYCNCILLISVDFLPTNSSIWRSRYYKIHTARYWGSTTKIIQKKKLWKMKKIELRQKKTAAAAATASEKNTRALWRFMKKVVIGSYQRQICIYANVCRATPYQATLSDQTLEHKKELRLEDRPRDSKRKK